MWLAAAEGKEDVLQLLLEKGAEKGKENKDGLTPFQVAEKNGHAGCMKLLE